MVSRDLKLHFPMASAILRTFKTALEHINREIHSRSYDFLIVCSKTVDSVEGALWLASQNTNILCIFCALIGSLNLGYQLINKS